jgi:pyrroloquinoline quinone (PQQ) biosynthesis protein C
METTLRSYGLRRVYDAVAAPDGGVALHLKDRVVELGPDERRTYARFAEWLPTHGEDSEVARALGLAPTRLAQTIARFEDAGLLYRKADVPASISGDAFHRDVFSRCLPAWLSEAFSHPFWERMMSGKGSARLFTGWMIELFHYTKNANRHMPLACAMTRDKAIKLLRAKHYAEEWNHYHYFSKSLKALGYAPDAIDASVPLPMTLALANFMRQAAREDVLCYSVCSAVLEGTTTDRGTYGPYYARASELYGIPKEAIAPIYAHLDLDVQYGHSDLFREILCTVPEISAARAARVLEYGHQLVEHIWMWTDAVERYYEKPENAVPRAPFDLALD